MSLNETLRDEIIAHAVDLERYKKRQVRRILNVLREVDKDVIQQIGAEGLTEFQARRLNQLSTRIRDLIRAAYVSVGEDIAADMQDFVRDEINFTADLLDNSVGVSFVKRPSINRVYAAAYARPYQGKLLRDYFQDLPDTLSELVRRQLRIGFLEGESQGQVNARVNRVLRGRKTNWTRAIVNTSVAHFGAVANQELYRQNSDALKGVQLLATLDTRTTDICMERDGRIWPVDKAPKLPFHINERSIYTPVLKAARAQKFKHLLKDQTRSDMDGSVPAKTNYREWLEKQSFTRQANAIGRRRAELHRDGGIAIADMFGNSRLLPLPELKKKFPDAFDVDSVPVSRSSAPRDFLLENGRRDGVEYSYTTRTGSSSALVVERGTVRSVSVSAGLEAAKRGGFTVDIYHNHPSSNSLSGPDLKVASLNEVSKIVAIGHDGSEYTAKVSARTPGQIEYAQRAQHHKTRAFLLNLINSDQISSADAEVLHFHIVNTALNNQGHIEYSAVLSDAKKSAFERNESLFRDLLDE